MTVDNPHVRQDTSCPICLGRKDRGLVACWSCYREKGLRYGNGVAEAMIAEREAELRRKRANASAWALIRRGSPS